MGDHSSQEIERRVLLLPPTKRDGEFTLALLAKVDLVGVVCPDLGKLCREMQVGAGAVVIRADALNADGCGHLSASLEQQPGWSDMPIILLLNTGQQVGLDDAIRSLGNVT